MKKSKNKKLTSAIAKHERPETPSKDQKGLLDGATATGAIDTPHTVYDYMRKKDFPYQEADFGSYRKKINEMSLGQLQTHAIEVAGIIPNTMERARLLKKLEDEYLTKHGKYITSFISKSVPQTNVSPEDTEKLKEIFSKRFNK